jgi:hypothetical protein
MQMQMPPPLTEANLMQHLQQQQNQQYQLKIRGLGGNIVTEEPQTQDPESLFFADEQSFMKYGFQYGDYKAEIKKNQIKNREIKEKADMIEKGLIDFMQRSGIESISSPNPYIVFDLKEKKQYPKKDKDFMVSCLRAAGVPDHYFDPFFEEMEKQKKVHIGTKTVLHSVTEFIRDIKKHQRSRYYLRNKKKRISKISNGHLPTGTRS